MLGDQKEAYRTLHPAYGTYIGGTFANRYPWATVPGAILGHITGNIAAAFVDDEQPSKPEIENEESDYLESEQSVVREWSQGSEP